MEDFSGQIIHPQTWPQDLDTSGRRVVVIGSGATAATIVPALAGNCAHVTMLQRSPTYFNIRPNVHELAQSLREIEIDENLIHQIVRKRILFDQDAFVRRCQDDPEGAKQELLGLVRAHAGGDVDIERHFTPSYRPWRQRIAMVPDGDLFTAMRDGHASVVTDEIDRFTETGIALKSGEVVKADIIVTATGFNLSVLGDIDFTIDGKPLDFHDTLTYRGMMFTGVPNMVWVFGYFRASWTLRSELIADIVCRLLAHMKSTGATSVVPAPRASEHDMATGPWIDAQDFNPGYLMRGLHLLPQSGPTREWQHTQDYWSEKEEFPEIDLTDELFVYDSQRASR
jgi:cation diffusion facilitator CzcD-associated flavoprotein CzcO